MGHWLLTHSAEAMGDFVAYLRSPQAIRERCDRLFQLALKNELEYFQLDLSRLDFVADYVLQVIQENYPGLKIPFHSRWRHFEVGNFPRLATLNQHLAPLSPLDQVKSKFDLAVVSVLLDAGAGANWQYLEEVSGATFNRSEGLAIASFWMFLKGGFSSDLKQPYQADVEGLKALTLEKIALEFQVDDGNFLIGLEGRLQLLQKLGEILEENPKFFGSEPPRPGNLVDYLLLQTQNNRLKATTVLSAVLEGLSEIWPGRIWLEGVNLGDVWEHSKLGTSQIERLVPFHKLSQWLTYSLLEPLEEIGLEITNLEEMTGLPEYRNGGLFLDLGLLQLKNPDDLNKIHAIDTEFIVEWRGLTVILLDKVAERIRQKLDLTSQELPLAKILQGGTWAAGRKIAKELRKDGIPPLKIQSDGTVF